LMFQIRNQSSSLLLFMERKKEASSWSKHDPSL
jgi:hypothetical protein